jgi:hypothetical protein
MFLTSEYHQILVIPPKMKVDFLPPPPKLEAALEMSRQGAKFALTELNSSAASHFLRPPHLGTIFYTVRSGFLKTASLRRATGFLERELGAWF